MPRPYLMPTVSVIIPTKNRGDLLMQTLDSVRAQTFADWEAIVVDDNSTDDTLVRLQQVVLDEPRIRYLTVPKPRSGAQAARNTGIEASVGRYLVLLDSDDLLAPFCLEHRLPVLEQDPTLDFAVFPCECFRTTPGDAGVFWNVDNGLPDLQRLLTFDVPWQTASPLWRREAMLRLMPWPEDVLVGQDWEFHIRAILAGMKYVRAGVPHIADLHWRLPQDDRETIGQRTFKPDVLRARVGVTERLLVMTRDAGRLDAAARDAFAGIFVQVAERLAGRVSRHEGLAFWAKARAHGIVTPKQYRQGRLYLWLHAVPPLRDRYRRHLERVWPAAFFVRRLPTFLNAPKPVPAEAAA